MLPIKIQKEGKEYHKENEDADWAQVY